MQTKQLDTGRIQLIPESPKEELALAYLSEHLPWIAGVELNLINAYLAGYDSGYNQAIIDEKNRI